MSEVRRPEGELRASTLGDLTAEENLRVGSTSPAPVVLSSTKHYGLVPSNEYFKNRTIYSDDLTNYKRVLKDWFAYATNHLAEGSIGRQIRFNDSCVSPIYTVFSCSEGVHPPYLERLLKSAPVIEQYKTHEQATVDRRGAVRYRDFAKVRVLLPPMTEQTKISEILDTLDTTIRQTEAIIEKLKQVKQGLLHDLLTRGIDANGELRPPQSEAPHLYKESVLGWIPSEWEALGLADMASPDRSVLRTGPFGSSLKGEHLTESGRPVVTIGSLGVGRFLTNELLYVSEETARVLTDFELLPGDIAFSRVADVGRSVVVREAERGWIMSSNFMRISVDSSRVAPEFLQAALAFDVRVKKQIRATVNSAGRDVASSAILMGLRFPVPSYQEQAEFNVRMAAIDQKIRTEEQFLMKIQAERDGLMHDLLTGRVRVTPLLQEGTAPP